MLHNLRTRLQGEEGFTLIELLVVILIIGILAAIAIPSFLNQKGKGEDTVAKTSVQSVQTALETFYTDNSNYDCTKDSAGNASDCDTQLHAIENSLPKIAASSATVADLSSTTPALVTPQGTNGSNYTITVESFPSGRTFTLSKTGGAITRSCVIPKGQSAGACKGTPSATADVTGSW